VTILRCLVGGLFLAEHAGLAKDQSAANPNLWPQIQLWTVLHCANLLFYTSICGGWSVYALDSANHTFTDLHDQSSAQLSVAQLARVAIPGSGLFSHSGLWLAVGRTVHWDVICNVKQGANATLKG